LFESFKGVFVGFKGTGGFHEKDRKAIRDICTLFLAIVIAFWGLKTVEYVFRDRKLTSENYSQYVRIMPVHGGQSTYNGSIYNYGFQFECLKRTVSDLKIEMTVIFKTWSGEVVSQETKTFEIDKLEKGKMQSRNVLSDVSVDYNLTYTLISISGEVA
jgi:hypothetical protein